MVQGPRDIDRSIEENLPRLQSSARAAELAHAAGVVPPSLDEVILTKSGNATEVVPLSEAGRAKVDEWLAGVKATREGLFTMFFIEHSQGKGTIVRPENAEKIEADIRTQFAPYYPEIAVPASEA